MKFPLILWLAIVPAAAAPLRCVQVGGDRVLAGDLATAIPVFRAVDPARDLGPAPLAGLRRAMSPEEIARMARSAGISLSGAAPILCIERTAMKLTAPQLLPVLQEAYSDVPARIEIVEFSTYFVPIGEIEFARSGLSATGFWRGRVAYGENRSASIWARVRIIDPETNQPIKQAPTQVSPPVLTAKEIERGDAVRIEVTSGNVLLQFAGIAESAGRLGDLIVVKNSDNGRRLQARVEAKGKVSIHK